MDNIKESRESSMQNPPIGPGEPFQLLFNDLPAGKPSLRVISLDMTRRVSRHLPW